MRSDRIQEIYNGLQAVTERRKREALYTALGYTSNLDLAAEFRAEDLNDLLAKYLPAGVLRAMRPAERIRTMEDLLETVVYYCLRGIGGEVDIEDPDPVQLQQHTGSGDPSASPWQDPGARRKVPPEESAGDGLFRRRALP